MKNLRNRADNICNEKDKQTELRHLNKVFHLKPIFKKTLQARQKQSPSGSAIEQPDKKVLYTPYVRGVSEKIERVCHHLGIRAVFRSENTYTQEITDENKNSKTTGIFEGSCIQNSMCGISTRQTSVYR